MFLLKSLMILIVTLSSCFIGSASYAEDEVVVEVPLRDVKDTAAEEKQMVDTKRFCSKVSDADAEQKCNAWVQSQKTSLGARLLTSHCSSGNIDDAKGCLYSAEGEVKYVISKQK